VQHDIEGKADKGEARSSLRRGPGLIPDAGPYLRAGCRIRDATFVTPIGRTGCRVPKGSLGVNGEANLPSERMVRYHGLDIPCPTYRSTSSFRARLVTNWPSRQRSIRTANPHHSALAELGSGEPRRATDREQNQVNAPCRYEFSVHLGADGDVGESAYRAAICIVS
jgi:hypothetical protein